MLAHAPGSVALPPAPPPPSSPFGFRLHTLSLTCVLLLPPPTPPSSSPPSQLVPLESSKLKGLVNTRVGVMQEIGWDPEWEVRTERERTEGTGQDATAQDRIGTGWDKIGTGWDAIGTENDRMRQNGTGWGKPDKQNGTVDTCWSWVGAVLYILRTCVVNHAARQSLSTPLPTDKCTAVGILLQHTAAVKPIGHTISWPPLPVKTP